MTIKGLSVFKEYLFDRRPIVRIYQRQSITSAIFIIYADYAILNMALHMIGTARHQQIGTGCLTGQRNLQAVRIIVPKRGESNVMPRGRSTERYSEFCFQHTFAHSGTQTRIINPGRFQRVTPLAYTLFG